MTAEDLLLDFELNHEMGRWRLYSESGESVAVVADMTYADKEMVGRKGYVASRDALSSEYVGLMIFGGDSDFWVVSCTSYEDAADWLDSKGFTHPWAPHVWATVEGITPPHLSVDRVFLIQVAACQERLDAGWTVDRLVDRLTWEHAANIGPLDQSHCDRAVSVGNAIDMAHGRVIAWIKNLPAQASFLF